ncbi:hypothetical protein GKZ28_06590 [Clostridium chromiireducens]|uniref:Cell wall-binding protein n=1 Tax=Clostridium chromiireducens TaxID=225345 RepID=A0A964RKP7_9CLOT|nr:hypothetical protein [Clostridium chromiireducens]MVX63365.1 hypothetical protein [Clostridium chromiireducens]
MRNVRLIASSLVVASILALNPIKANAEWIQDNNGWKYTEGNSYVKGTWKSINGNWYYFFADGYMAHNTSIDGYYVNSSGAWVTNSNSSSSTTSSETKIVTSSSPQYSVADINDEWRTKYFRGQVGLYNGVKNTYLDNITKAVGDGSLSPESAKSQINAIDGWSEPDGVTSYKIISVDVNVYETPINDPLKIFGSFYQNRMLIGGTYENSYAYYDSSTGQYRIVLVAVDLIKRITTTTVIR